MQSGKVRQLARQGIAAVLLFGISLVASAEQMMRALPAPAAPQPVAALPAVQQIAAPAAMSPIASPPGPPTKPMSLTGPSTAPMSQMKLVQPIPSGGMAQLNPAAACGMNPAPRISNINGTQSGIEFQPGSNLNIAGCGFGKGGRALLRAGGANVPLKIDSWGDNNILAHIDPALGGVTNLDSVNVTVIPNGAPAIVSAGNSRFRAVHETIIIPLPPELGIYSKVYEIYGLRKSDSYYGQYTRVERDFTYTPFCPAVTSQSQMEDSWPIDSNFYEKGFIVLGVNYTNQTNQNKTDNDEFQDVLVGGDGQAIYNEAQKRVTVTFQAHSTYKKKHLLPGSPLKQVGGQSRCTSSYVVSLTVNGPRGVAPFK